MGPLSHRSLLCLLARMEFSSGFGIILNLMTFSVPIALIALVHKLYIIPGEEGVLDAPAPFLLGRAGILRLLTCSARGSGTNDLVYLEHCYHQQVFWKLLSQPAITPDVTHKPPGCGPPLCLVPYTERDSIFLPEVAF